MAQFTNEQLQAIRESEEWKEFVKKWEAEEIDRDATLDDYLKNVAHESYWINKFNEQSVENLKEELAKAEHELDSYLGMMYVEEHPDENITPATWDSEKYKEWVRDYAVNHPSDQEYQVLLNHVEDLKKQTNQDESSKNLDNVVVNEDGDNTNENINNQEAKADDVDVNIIPDNEEKDDIKKEEFELAGEKRLRSSNSDKNEEVLDRIRLETMYQLGHISEEIYNAGMKDPKRAMTTINSKMPLKESQMVEFEMKFAEIVVESDSLDLLPPSILAKLYNRLKEQTKEKESKTNDNKEGLQKGDDKAQQQLNAVTSYIDSLIAQAAKKEGLYFGDITNISDTYEGYMAMMSARQKDVDANSVVAKNIEVVKAYLEGDIKEYDSLMNLDREGLDATKLYERFDKIEAGMKKVELRPEDLQMLSSIKFTNEQGDPIPQFVDKDGKDVLEYSEGCKVKDDSQLDTIVKVAKAQVLQEELGSTADVKEICTPQRLEEQVSSIMYAASVVSKTQQGIGEQLDEFTKDGKLDEEKLHSFVNKISQEDGMSINPEVYEKTLDNMVDGRRLSQRQNNAAHL